MIEGQRPGTILCKNLDNINPLTGEPSLIYARPDMLEQKGYNLIRVTPEFKEEVVSPSSKETEKPNVYLTKQGKPFKTEVSARNAMKAQKIDENEYVVIAAEGGFIITKV